jgi:hypothetical protein
MQLDETFLLEYQWDINSHLEIGTEFAYVNSYCSVIMSLSYVVLRSYKPIGLNNLIHFLILFRLFRISHTFYK